MKLANALNEAQSPMPPNIVKVCFLNGFPDEYSVEKTIISSSKLMSFSQMMEILVAKHDQLNLTSRNKKSGVALLAEAAPTAEANSANVASKFKPKGNKGRNGSPKKDANQSEPCRDKRIGNVTVVYVIALSMLRRTVLFADVVVANIPGSHAQ